MVKTLKNYMLYYLIIYDLFKQYRGFFYYYLQIFMNYVHQLKSTAGVRPLPYMTGVFYYIYDHTCYD